VVIALALLAAVANALATVLQRVGLERAASAQATTRELMSGALRQAIWYAGLGLTIASFLLQAFALANGNLSTVQPIMVTEIVFLLLVLWLFFHYRLGWREWVGAGGTAAGLGAFLALSASTGGNSQPSPQDWILLLIAAVGAIAVATAAGSRGPGAWRAASTGVAAGVCFALTAAFIKSVAVEWPRGVIYVFTHLEAYGVAIAGLVGLVLSQRALRVGPVAASQAALLIVNPISSIVMGIWLFDDDVRRGGVRTAFELAALAVMFFALFLLSTSPLIARHSGEQLSAPVPVAAAAGSGTA
jgi:drug/metabolite transporter (DMT)-like permease